MLFPHCYVLKNVLKWHAFPPAFIQPSVNNHAGFSETRLTKILMGVSSQPKLSNSGSSCVTKSLHGEVLTS